jgi:hypothetical protein
MLTSMNYCIDVSLFSMQCPLQRCSGRLIHLTTGSALHSLLLNPKVLAWSRKFWKLEWLAETPISKYPCIRDIYIIYTYIYTYIYSIYMHNISIYIYMYTHTHIHTIQYNTMQCNAIQYNTIHDNTIQYITLHYVTLHYITLHTCNIINLYIYMSSYPNDALQTPYRPGKTRPR